MLMLLFADEKLVLRLDKFLEGYGLTRQGRSGLIGNLYAESGVRLDNLQNSYEKKWNITEAEYIKSVDKGTWKDPINGMTFVFDKAGFGLAQWTSSGRKQGLINYAHELNESIASENVQFGWLIQELKLKYKNVLAILCDTNATIEDCAEVVVLRYEVPGSVLGDEATKQKTINTRIGYAREVHNFLFGIGNNEKIEEGNLNLMDLTAFDLKVCILTNNGCYKKNQKMSPEGIIVHSTGANNPSLKRYVQPDDGLLGSNTYNNHWNKSGVNKCVHAFIGKDKNGTVRTYQTLPFDVCCWGIGRGSKGSYNYPATKTYPNDRAYIQFEICEDGLTDATYFNAVMEEAQKFCAYLIKKFPNISLDNVISHHEGYLRGMGSSHADIDHWLTKHGKTMAWFRQGVWSALNANEAIREEPKTESETKVETKVETKTETTYKVKVTDSTKILPKRKTK